MGSLLQIKVLGEFAVHRDGADVALPPSRKTRALLAYLAVTNRPQRREMLCDMFWEVPDDPRGSLRWSLSKLRQVLAVGDDVLLEADRNSVKLKHGQLAVDYDVLRGHSAGTLGNLDVGQLENIVSRFSGPFLADLQLPRCPTFEAWRVALDNETHLLRLNALRLLIDRLEDAPDRALGHAQVLKSLCPDDDMHGEIEPIIRKARALAAGRDGRRGTTRVSAKATTSAPGHGKVKRQQTIRFCRSRDGVRIAYAICGDGPAIVRTGHWMSHLEYDWESPVWEHWLDGLTDGFKLIRYDQRLNGLSDQKADDLSLDALVGDLECVVDTAGLDRFVLLGVSQGCAQSVRYAARHPDRIAGMILYGGYVRGWRARGDPGEVARREAMAVLIREGWGRDDPAFRQLFTNLFIPGASREQMNWFNELQKRTVTPENAYRLTHAFADVDVSDVVAQVRVPTLVLHARDDQVVPFASGLPFAEQIPDARFVELDSSNHILLAEEPAFHRFMEVASAFARERLADAATKTRRYATLLCADFVSPLQAFADLDPEAALEAVDPVVAEAASLVRDSGGFIFDLADSRLTASFGTHQARDDHAGIACRTGLKLAELARRVPTVRVRVTLDTGDVIIAPARIADAGLEVRGAPLTAVHTLNRALRRDLVVATERTRAAAGGSVRMERLADEHLSGFARWQPLFRVVDPGGNSGDA